MKQQSKKLYMIGNAHIDPVWLWQWQEGFQEVKATFRSVLDRIAEYEDFVFTASSAVFFAWVEQNDPAMFQEIRQQVERGTIELAGGWWLEPDCNAPCGESFVRQSLYGQRYFQEKFGKMARTGYNVDSFGHHAMLPQILKKSGMENYVFMRPGRHEKAIGDNLFEWEGADGSSVTAFRILFEYCTWPDEIEGHIRHCAGEIRQDEPGVMCFYGVGNHGGGPTKRNIDSIHAMQGDRSLPQLVLSTPDRYFADVQKQKRTLPRVRGELFHHASGCYSAHSEVKRLNRKAENRLLCAEKLSVLAQKLTGQPYPLDDYTSAWKAVLFNQFHDIMAGTSIEPAYTDARESYGFALHHAAEGMNYALQAISWQVDIPFEDGMKPIVVFNPHAFAQTVPVELESVSLPPDTALLDCRGSEVPYQLVQSKATMNGRCRICFEARLPALGYTTYRLVKNRKPREHPRLDAGNGWMENRFLRLEIDEKTGYLRQLLHKQSGTSLLEYPAAVPSVLNDGSDTWSHEVRIFDKRCGTFRAESVSLAEHGAVKAVIRVSSRYGESRLVQDFTMYREQDSIEVSCKLDWREKRQILKLDFPLNLMYSRGSYEIPYGFAEREPSGEEMPMQNWIDFEGSAPQQKDATVGLSILNDGKASCSADNKLVSITAARSPIYAHHTPHVPDESLEYTYLDHGIQEFTYVLYPHGGSRADARTAQLAASLNQKPAALIETFHKGTLPQERSFLQCDCNTVMLGAMKLAEDKSGDIIVRLTETAKRRAEGVTVSFGFLNSKVKLDFEPLEIKTLRISARDGGAVCECSLIEFDEADAGV